MANNPYVNKVVYGNNTVMDISDSDVAESDVASGKVFYKGSGQRSVGTAVTPDISNCYETTDSMETDIEDTDYLPFYDSSATAKKNTLWSNIKAKLKTYFDTLYATYLGVGSLISTTVGWSVKNILNCDIESGSQVKNGLSIWVGRNAGGQLTSITINGTATDATYIQVASSVSDDEFDELTGDKYILSGCAPGGSTSTYYLEIWGSNGIRSYKDTGQGVLISHTIRSAVVEIFVANGVTCNNLSFYPMIRNKNVADDTYEPYHANVAECLDSFTASVVQANDKVVFDNLDASYGYELWWDDRGAYFDLDDSAKPYSTHTKKEAGTTTGTIKLTFTIEGGTNGSSYFALRILK